MTFGLRCSGPACRPHPASLPVRVPTVESLPPASFGFPLAVAPCGLATVAVIGPDWLLSSNKTLPMLGTPRAEAPASASGSGTRASRAVQGDRPTNRRQREWLSERETKNGVTSARMECGQTDSTTKFIQRAQRLVEFKLLSA